MNHINIAKLNVCHLGCKHGHGFLSIQYSKIFDSSVIPRIQYFIYIKGCSLKCYAFASLTRIYKKYQCYKVLNYIYYVEHYMYMYI